MEDTPQPTPALPPPPGVTSNFDSPESLSQQLRIGTGIVVPITTIFVFLRIYVRIWIRKAWVLEDWFLLVGYAGTIILVGFGEATMSHYGGRHEWDITKAQGREAAYWFSLCSIEYAVVLFFAKVTVLQVYRRVFSPHRWSPFDISIVAMAVFLLLFHISTTLVKIFECNPREKIYDSDVHGTCINIPVLFTTIGVINTITDIVILLLPVKAVWGMKLQFKKKVIVVLVFTFGLAAPAFSFVGFIVRLQGTNNPDKNWHQPAIILWGLLEIATGVICASFPELGPIFARRKNRATPSASIVNGRYRYYDSGAGYRKSAGRMLPARLSQGMRGGGTEGDTYFELEEGDSYDVRATAHNRAYVDADGERQNPGEITVTREVRIASNTVG